MRRFKFNYGALLAWAVVLFTVWQGFREIEGAGRFATSPVPPGYYGLLTEALLDGQVSLKLAPEPELLRLKDPYAGPQGANRPHDMSFYKGKFYLYYGITPAIALMMPWKIITGTYLTEPATTLLFCVSGLALCLAWFLTIKKRYFAALSEGWTVLCVLTLGIGSPVFILTKNQTFYAVPISAAYCFLMLGLIAVQVGTTGRRFRKFIISFAFASAALGFAVGARPNYILVLLALAIAALPTFLVYWKTPRSASRLSLILAAIVVPAGIVGAGLAAYNYFRFGSPFEFGMQYSMASASLVGKRLVSLGYIGKNLRIYLLKPADFVRYFPFFYTGTGPYGILPHFSLAGLALAPLFLRKIFRPDVILGATVTSVVFIIACAVGNLAVLCLFFGGENRYLVDFGPAGLAAGVYTVLAAAEATKRQTRFVRGSVTTLLVGLALWSVINGFYIGISESPWKGEVETVRRMSDRLVYTLEKHLGSEQGPLELNLTWPKDKVAGTKEPLVTTGSLAGTGDILYVVYVNDTHVRFGFFHLGAGGPLSEMVATDYTKPHLLRIHLGSLLPGSTHPLFQGWTTAQIEREKRHMSVELDGAVVFKASVTTYPSTPAGVDIGGNKLAADVTAPRFSGKLSAVHRMTIPASPPAGPLPSGPVRLKVTLPDDTANLAMPLISTGVSGAGDLLSVIVTKGSKIQFVHDCWGSSDFRTEPIALSRKPEHVIEVEMGSLYGKNSAEFKSDLGHRLLIRLDGVFVADVERPFNPADLESVEFGINAIGASSAVGMYTGAIIETARIPSSPRAPSADFGKAISMTLVFPPDAAGLVEPLLTIGTTFDFAIVLVAYGKDGSVRLGVDRRNGSLQLGPPLHATEGTSHRCEISLEGLRARGPHADSAATGKLAKTPDEPTPPPVIIKLDDTEAFSGEVKPLFSSTYPVAIGKNDVSSTNSRRVFSGKISAVEHQP